MVTLATASTKQLQWEPDPRRCVLENGSGPHPVEIEEEVSQYKLWASNELQRNDCKPLGR